MALIFPQGASIVPFLFEKLDTQGNFNSLPFSANSLRGTESKAISRSFHKKKTVYLLNIQFTTIVQKGVAISVSKKLGY